MAFDLGFTGDQVAKAEKIMMALSKVFLEKDASLAEINPLAVTKKGDVVVLDAKIDFDDNALFRHKDIAALRDLAEENPDEMRAGKASLNLHPARRHHRLPGERGRPGDGHDGHRQATTAATRPTSSTSAAASRRRRRRSVPHHPVGSEGEGRFW